jgi:hypothetical protein
VSGLRELWGTTADVALADRAHPFAAARAGWFARVDCLVLPLTPAEVRRWGPLDRWAWHSLPAHGLIAPAHGGEFQERPGELDLDRIALWPAQESDGDAGEAAADDTEILERACERALARHRARAPRPAVVRRSRRNAGARSRLSVGSRRPRTAPGRGARDPRGARAPGCR